jgi:hypothetical protein
MPAAEPLWPHVPETSSVPAAACCPLVAISRVVAPCSSTAAAMVPAISLMRHLLALHRSSSDQHD